MKAILIRGYQKNYTLGTLVIFNGEKKLAEVKTLELGNNGNQRNISCIPEGEYDVIKYNDENRGKCFHILAVRDRSGILIHKGNFTKDTKGCLIPGMAFDDINDDGWIDVIQSTQAMDKLNENLPDRFKLLITSA